MFARAWRSEIPASELPSTRELSATAAVQRQRADSRIALSVERQGTRTGLVRKAEAGSARARLPRVPGPALEAVLINTAGGLAEGDRVETEIAVGPGADLMVTTPAAEKVYRSDGATTQLAVTLTLAAGARLDWLPQETILYNTARLSRRLDVDMAANAALMLFEATAFGRAAHGERVKTGLFEDRWRIRRDGRLVYADSFRLAGEIDDRLRLPTVANGARAIATLLHVAPDGAARIEEARALLEGALCECGAGAWNGILGLRFLAPDIETLRRDAARVITGLAARALPRVWHL